MPRTFNQREYDLNDKKAYDFIAEQFNHFKISNYHHIEDYDIDVTMYSKKTGKPLCYLELERINRWTGKHYPYSTINFYRHKVDKYRNYELPSFYVQLSANGTRVSITNFKNIKLNEYNGWVNRLGGADYQSFYKNSLDVTDIIDTKWIEEYLKRYLYYGKRPQLKS